MSQNVEFKAESRNSTGKGAARAARREGRIPGVIYGGGETPVHVTLPEKEFSNFATKRGYKSTILEINLDGKKIKAVAREVQLHPVTDKIEHFDLQKVVDTQDMRVFIPVKFLNREKSPGIKRGGILNIVRREIEFLCNPSSIPNIIEINLEGREIGESVHISHINLPDTIKPIIKRDFTIATIVGKGGKAAAEEAADEAADAEQGAEKTPDAKGEKAAKAE
ncbi:MAG: 50S ribosomal protein L25/general stress protein Ctc [Alphaproteobacteria bacterium CG11_big_fil_rev_8_21_14_0_20_44_7]|nr:MAG: 50S ribosomal protein L25/general stress protein Ctc [Alphaproteobacteria bacterium CG11_big_fil_rev_8_21_14_0_20_44_7]